MFPKIKIILTTSVAHGGNRTKSKFRELKWRKKLIRTNLETCILIV